jgi:signal transduction histidine kinase
VRTPLEVLRQGESADRDSPLPGIAALPGLTRPAGAGLTVTTGPRTRIPPAVDAAAYRIVQEALTNTTWHGGPAARATVLLEVRGQTLHLTVTDDGAAPAAPATPGFGLVSMRERARTVGGTLTAARRPAGGFEVRAQLPLGEGREEPA